MGERVGSNEAVCRVMAIDFLAKQVYNLTSLYNDGNTEYSMGFL
jgi:hypothetical protein